MKKKLYKFRIMLIITLTNLLICSSLWAQSPEKMSYQAVIRNNSGALVDSTTIGMKLSILQGTPTGTVVYTETLTPFTNANGLVNIEFGGGAGFSTIDWANGPYFIKTETDPLGGTAYTITGTSQLLSVPYALHAKTAGSTTETKAAFYAYNNTDTNINTLNWFNYLPFKTERYDIGNNFNDTVFTAPVSGIYNFSARVNFENINVETMILLSIFVNGSQFTRLDRIYSSSTVSHMQSAGGSIDLHLNAGNRVSIHVYMYNDSDYIISGGNYYSYFTGHLVYAD